MMTTFARCKSCGSYDFLDRHRCPPLWEVRMDGEDEWNEAHGYDEEAAVTKWLDDNDCHMDYFVIRRGKAKLFVRKPGDEGPGVEIGVRAESLPHYYAHKKG